MMPPRSVVFAATALTTALLAVIATGADPTPLRVKVFPGVHNLALFAAQTQGFFARRDLAVDLSFTPNSQGLREGLAQGAFEIAHAAADNAVAMVDYLDLQHYQRALAALGR